MARSLRLYAAPALGLAAFAASCTDKPPQAPVGITPAPTDEVAPVIAPPVNTKPKKEVTLASVGLDEGALDRKTDPCSDFYRFACGGWIDKTEIPADKSRWVRSFNEIDDRNEADLKRLLEAAALAKTADPAQQKLGDFYGACMDEAAAEKLGRKPIDADLGKIDRANTVAALLALVPSLHARGIAPFFDVSAEQDFKDATRYIIYLDQGGLGLPDRDYYLNDDDRSKELRGKYAAHVERLFVLAGRSPAAAKSAAAEVLAVETELAKVSKTKVERRDPGGLYNKIDRTGIEKAAPLFPWAAYFKALGLDGVNDVNVTAPKFFEGMNALLSTEKLGAWKSYLSFQLLHRASPLLSKAYVDEAFALERDLTGQKEQRTRWKRCVDAADSGLGELLAQQWVKERFSPEAKASVQAMVREIGQAFSESVGALPWMDESTRGVTRDKLAAMAYLIGYPDKWKAYDFPVKRGTHAENVFAARAHELKTRLGRIGKPVDRGEWFMTPPTVNAYYDPQKNQMVFPAGILQPPFYSPTASVAVNLGAMGMVVGHELTHGFDDEGSQFDKNGNLLAWWPQPVRDRYMKQTECIRDQYGGYEPLPGVKVNGQLTLGENIADNGGVKLAFRAYRAMRRDAAEELVASGFGEDQQFFLATGQLWCSKYREEAARMQVKVDPHSPTRFRVNGPLANSPEFAAAFQCKAGSAMAPPKRCDVW